MFSLTKSITEYKLYTCVNTLVDKSRVGLTQHLTSGRVRGPWPGCLRHSLGKCKAA